MGGTCVGLGKKMSAFLPFLLLWSKCTKLNKARQKKKKSTKFNRPISFIFMYCRAASFIQLKYIGTLAYEYFDYFFLQLADPDFFFHVTSRNC